MDVRAASAAVPSAPERSGQEAERAQVARLAREFEAMFMSEMLRGMRQSMLSDEQDEGLGADTMTDTFDGELGRSLAQGRGLGLATIMLDALMKRGAGGDSSDDPVRTAARANAASPASVPLATPAPALMPSRSASSIADVVNGAGTSQHPTLPGPVTSPFGWRSDPFSGRPQFHAGTDVRLAYGQNVQAVSPGRVQSVGERSGYGLTVVIDHGNGLETRYAHLSGASVREGDRVEAGQVVAQSGSSGRSTGPHLHLEARQNGRAVEIAALLKETSLRADSYADRTHVRSGHED